MRIFSIIMMAIFLLGCHDHNEYRTYSVINYEYIIKMPRNIASCASQSWTNVHGYFFVLGENYYECKNAPTLGPSRFVSIYADFNSTLFDSTYEYAKKYCTGDIIPAEDFSEINLKGGYFCKEDSNQKISMILFKSYLNGTEITGKFPKNTIGQEIFYKFAMSTDKSNYHSDINYFRTLIAGFKYR